MKSETRCSDFTDRSMYQMYQSDEIYGSTSSHNNLELQSDYAILSKSGYVNISMNVEVGPQPNGTAKKRVYVNEKGEMKFTLESDKKYNPYLIPPDWKAAERHGVSSQAG